MLRPLLAVSVAALLVACSDDAVQPVGDSTGSAGAGAQAPLPTTFGGERPVELFVPESYDGSPAPLLILLHGYSASGTIQELYWGLEGPAAARGMLYAHPDGTIDASGKKFWNATDACCGFGASDVDDSAYLIGLVDEIAASYAVDPKRIYFAGHSNGSFMSFRMACDHADRIAAIAGLAGAMFADPADCAASEPVHVLHVHGTADETIAYEGGQIVGAEYPGAEASVAFWAAEAGCEAAPVASSPIDLISSLDGPETAVARHEGCEPGGSAELWTIEGGEHVPGFNEAFAPALLDFLLAHPKP